MMEWWMTCRTQRTQLYLDQRRASEIAGVSLTTWSRWERGITEPEAHEKARVLEEFRRYEQMIIGDKSPLLPEPSAVKARKARA